MKRRLITLFTILLSVSLIATYSCKKEKDKSVAVTEVRLDKTATTLVEGDTEELMATVMPENATDKGIEWKSSDESVATVSQTGLVTALKEGPAVITVITNDGGFEATCNVTVNKKVILVSEVELNKIELTLDEGKEEKLVVTVKPDDATDKSVVWESSNTSVATVDQEGLVKAVTVGTAQITVKTKDGVQATCEVTVNKKVIPVTEVQLNKETMNLMEGDEERLVVTVKPDDATDKSVVWESSNETVVTVEQDGLVKAVREGDAQITVTAKNGVSASCLVGVSKKDIPVTGIKLNYISMELNVGTGGKLTATVEPENATVQDVEWKSSDPAVVAVHNGYVTAKKEGQATITVTTVDGGFTASCEVKVKTIPVTGIAFEQSSLLLPVGNTYTLRAHVQPSNATDQDIKWGSSNGGVATVDQTGKVTAVAAGTADILATLAGKFARCTVQVDNVKLSMKTSSYMILPRSRPINIKSNIDANFELDYSKLSFSYSDQEVATIGSDFDIETHGKKGTTKVDVLYKYGNGELKTSFTITVQ